MLKITFPGDPEFSYERFPYLPYPYVLSAYKKAGELRQRGLHEQERPVSMLASIMVNQARDPKKNKTVEMSDFYLYEPKEQQNLPSGRYGSAAVALAKSNQFPAWALFCFRQLSQGASGSPPSVLAYIGSDCMLLAPVAASGGYTGLFIGMESASEQIRELKSPDGKTVTLKIPFVETKIVAEEDVFLQSAS
jgi:hypothetical protein